MNPRTPQTTETPNPMMLDRKGTTLSKVVRMPKMPFRPLTTRISPITRNTQSQKVLALWRLANISSMLFTPLATS